MGFRDWFKKQRQKEKESVPEPEKPREPPAEEPEETPESVADEIEAVSPKSLAEKAEEPTSEPIAEEKAELAPESPTQEAEKPVPEPVAREPEELTAEQPPTHKTEKPIPSPWKLAFKGLFKRRKPEKKEKESASEPEKPRESPAEEPEPTVEPAADYEPEELTPEPPAEEINEPTPEAVSEATEEPTPEPVADEIEAVSPKSLAEKAEEPTSEPIAEEKAELASEPETPEPTPELTVEETEEMPSEPMAEKTEKPTPKPRRFRPRDWFKKRKQKKKEKKSAPEPEFLKILIFPITLASMLLGLSIMPLFPQPLPAVLAFLIAFFTYKKPRIGMPIGGLIIGIGLIYNLSKMNFISMLGAPETRGAVVFVFLFLFTVLPLVFHSRKAVISINLGIIAAILLFFSQTYFLAIPLILTAMVLFKKLSFLTVIYYGLISVPLQIMQYLNFVLPISRWDWWIEPGTSPPIYVPLTEVFTEVQESMLQFRLYDTSQVVYSITEQITLDPPVMQRTVLEMLSHYFDSLPGIILFLFMVIGIVSAFILLTRTFLAKSNISHGERLLPTMSATVAVALFFILANSLQVPLAFRVDINGAQIAIATFATLILTLPTFLFDYTPKKTATIDMILEKAEELKAKLQVFEDELSEVKSRLPISCGSFEVKMLIIKDKLNDVLSKTSRLSEASEINEIFNELDSLSHEIDSLANELNVSVGEYQIFVNCEYSKWFGLFKDMGLETEVTVKTVFQKEAPLKTRIDQIEEVLEGGRSLANEIIEVAEQVYEVIRSFYDPSLPEESQSIAFAQKKLDEKATLWIVLDALFTALNNWNKQYKVQISKSVDHLQTSLAFIANLSTKNEKLLPVLGDDFPKMMANAEKAENIKSDLEKKPLNIVNVVTIKDVFYSSLSIGRDVLSILHKKLKSKEKAIELLAPSEDFLWEKNDALMKQLSSAMRITSKSSEDKLSDVLETLPKFLSYVDECIETIVLYSEIEELLLNYPIAEIAVEDLFRQKTHISAKDLPFEPKYAEEYLKLFYSQRYREFSFDKANLLLTKKM